MRFTSLVRESEIGHSKFSVSPIYGFVKGASQMMADEKTSCSELCVLCELCENAPFGVQVFRVSTRISHQAHKEHKAHKKEDFY
jgi:hypothetical protein